MKKLFVIAIALSLALITVFSFTACGFNKNNENEILPFASADEVLRDPIDYDEERLRLEGRLPQACVYDKGLAMLVPAVMGEKEDGYIIIDGVMPEYGSCKVIITGTIHSKDGSLTITAEKYEIIEESFT